MAEIQEIRIPDIGDFDEVTVVEVLVQAGQQVEVDEALIILESDKASMEVPSPLAGVVRELKVSEGDTVGQDAVILSLEPTGDAGQASESSGDGQGAAQGQGSEPQAEPQSAEPQSTDSTPAAEPTPQAPAASPTPARPAPDGSPARTAESGQGAEDSKLGEDIDEAAFAAAHAGPGVRRYARELGVNLGRVSGSGRKGRILKEDVQAYVQAALSRTESTAGAGHAGIDGFQWPQMPEIDFARFGPVESKPLPRIRRLSATNLHRSWLHVPHVTQHDEADITEMEAFRKSHGEEAKARGIKLTPLAFLLKAAAAALQAFPEFNSSLASNGESLILKRYYHLGVAVDTPDGLVVPVMRDVDQKGLFALAEELGEVSVRAREGKLQIKDLQGATFTISSLGGIGGTAFTPIVNAPEVAILGVSRHRWMPVWQGQDFAPRLMLPLSLSYDHRVIDGASAARFTVHLSRLLGDLRRLLL